VQQERLFKLLFALILVQLLVELEQQELGLREQFFMLVLVLQVYLLVELELQVLSFMLALELLVELGQEVLF
jgi:hypothetical protein